MNYIRGVKNCQEFTEKELMSFPRDNLWKIFDACRSAGKECGAIRNAILDRAYKQKTR